ENSRNSRVTSTHTVCEPESASLVLQQPSRKNPVKGLSLQPTSSSPNTLTERLMTWALIFEPSTRQRVRKRACRSELRAVGRDPAERVAAVGAVLGRPHLERDLVADLYQAIAPAASVIVVQAVSLVLDVARAFLVGDLEHDLRVRIRRVELFHDA